METIEWQWHEVIALINALCPQSKLLNHQWHFVRTVRTFCFFTLIGCFDQRLFGDPALSFNMPSSGKWQLAGFEEPFVESQTKTKIDQTERAEHGSETLPEYD